MYLTAKVWCDDEHPPIGMFNHDTCPSAPDMWFREPPQVAVKLYALERGVGDWWVNVVDDNSTTYRFHFVVQRQLAAYQVAPRETP